MFKRKRRVDQVKDNQTKTEKVFCQFFILNFILLAFSIAPTFAIAGEDNGVGSSQASAFGELIDWQQIPTPPRFIHTPNPLIVYFAVDYANKNGVAAHQRRSFNAYQQDIRTSNVFSGAFTDDAQRREKTLRCEAVGVPHPIYNWLKDNVSLPLHMFRDRVSQSRTNGSLTFTVFTEADEGIYQCIASNDNGTAYSEAIQLQQAWIRPFPDFEPETVSVELGDPYSRNCTPPESSPEAHIFWLFRSPKDNQFLQAINSSHISSNDRGTIFFHNVQESDFKENRFYACAAYNSELMEYKFSNRFNFVIKKSKRDRLNTVIPASEQYVNQSSPVALVGQLHKLHCFFSGYPDPYPTWYHNGVEVMSNNTQGFTLENYGKTLVFNVTPEHMGKYECRFQSHASAVDRIFNVKVESAPYWHDIPPANTNTSEGETVVFNCRTSGNPAPIVTFYKNGVEMRRPRQGENWVIDGSRLTIYDVKKNVGGDGDNAVYQCKSENRHGYLWTNFYLNLLSFQPKLLEIPGIVEAIEGRSFTMSCKFFASPIANVTWESPLLSGADYRTNVDQFGMGWMIFEEIKPSYEGEYKCIGTNKYGSDTGIIRLLVRKPTKLDPFPEEKVRRQAGLTLKLPCMAVHDPNLEIKYEWTVDGKVIDVFNRFQDQNLDSLDGVNNESEIEESTDDVEHYKVLSDHTLLVRNPTQHDTGIYTCTASTKLDFANKSIHVDIEDVPVPVYSAYIAKCDTQGNSATIQLEHLEPSTGTVPVKEFWVRYVADPEEEQGHWKTHPASIRAIDYEVVDDLERRVRASITIPLHPFGTYVFQVIARNSIGDSAPQTVKGECLTGQKAPTKNPSGVRVEGSQPDNLIVYWTPMPREEWNGEKFSYQILYKPRDDSGLAWQSVQVDDPFADKVTIDLGERRPWEPFEVQVKAHNTQGDSLVTPEVVEGRTGEGDPGVTPSNLRVTDIGATSATFHWDALNVAKVQGNFTGYKLIYWYDEEDSNGTGEKESIVKEARMSRRHALLSSGAVLRPVLDAQFQNSISMTKSKRILRRRTVSSTLTSAAGLHRKTVHVAPDVNSATVTNLKPNSMNYATIAVKNGQNEGTPSEVISFKTKEGVPAPVRNLVAHAINGRATKESIERGVVILHWNVPRAANGRLTHFGVARCRTREYGLEVTSCEKEKILPPNIHELRMTGLEYDTSYRFRVIAYTKAGPGIPNSADVKTLPEALQLNVDPEKPSLVSNAVAEDHFNVTFVPGSYKAEKGAPVGNSYYIKYRESDDDEWQIKHSDGESLELQVDKLTPGTRYHVAAVAVFRDSAGRIRESESRHHAITTSGVSPKRAQLYWIVLILIILLVLLLLICLVIILARHRGHKYPVAEKERLHGREPILTKERAFDEYGRSNDDEKRSLTGHSRINESETDSMAEFGEGDPGRFTEDGSFIGQYGRNTTLVVTTTSTIGTNHHHPR